MKRLFAAILIFTAVFAVAGSWKYAHYRYTGIDLAYFAQVFWNTVHGRPFAQSIHPHLSLGDHAELAIPLIAIPYALWQDPRMLILLQALTLALPAWPLLLIARRRLAGTRFGRVGPPAVAAAWLLHPAVQNPALFEFHVLPFALVPLAFALLAYERERKAPFLLWCSAALLAREDVALVVGMIGVLAWFERRKRWWIFAPALLGAVWFFASMRLIAHFEPAGGYKYLIYYAWLGATPLAALSNAGAILRHVAALPNLELVVGLAFPLLFLPFIRPKRLVLALGPFLQAVLSSQGGGALTFQTHYAVLFLPGLFLAAIEGLPALEAWLERRRLPFGAREIAAGFMVAAVYGAVTLGPLPAVAAAMTDPESMVEASEGDAAVAAIPAGVPVAASYDLLPHLASREGLYSLHYQFLGVTQYGEEPYAVPADVRVVAEDRRDLLTYRSQYEGIAWAEPRLVEGEARLRALMSGTESADGPYRLFGVTHVVAPASYAVSVPAGGDVPAGAVLHAELSQGARIRAVDLPVESPVTSVLIPIVGFAPGPAAFTARLELQRTVYAIDGLRTPKRFILSRRAVGPVFAKPVIIPPFDR